MGLLDTFWGNVTDPNFWSKPAPMPDWMKWMVPNYDASTAAPISPPDYTGPGMPGIPSTAGDLPQPPPDFTGPGMPGIPPTSGNLPPPDLSGLGTIPMVSGSLSHGPLQRPLAPPATPPAIGFVAPRQAPEPNQLTPFGALSPESYNELYGSPNVSRETGPVPPSAPSPPAFPGAPNRAPSGLAAGPDAPRNWPPLARHPELAGQPATPWWNAVMSGMTEHVGYAPEKAGSVPQIITDAAKTVDVDPHYMLNIAGHESGYDVNAKSDTGARGLFQFIPSTWKAYITKYGPLYGFGPDTPPTNAKANALMAAHYTKDSIASLRSITGREPTPGDLYMAHFLGPQGAAKVLMADPSDTMDRVMPAVYNSSRTNKAAMTGPDGRPLTVAAFQQKMAAIAGTSGNPQLASAAPGGIPTAAPPAAPPAAQKAPVAPPVTAPNLASIFNPNVNQSVNFGRNAPIWQTLASLGTGMLNAPPYLGFTGALGQGLKSANQTLLTLPQRQLQQALAQGQLGVMGLTTAQKLALLQSVNSMPPGPMRTALTLALSGVSGRGVLESILPHPPPGTRYVDGGNKVENIPGSIASTSAAKVAETAATKGTSGDYTTMNEYRTKAMGYDTPYQILGALKQLVPYLGAAPGSHAEELLGVKKAMQRLGLIDQNDQSTTASELFRKLAIQLPINALKADFGARPAQNEFLLSAERGYPNLEMQKSSIGPVITSLMEQMSRARDRSKFMEDWYYSHGNSLRGAATAWNEQHGKQEESGAVKEVAKAAPTPMPQRKSDLVKGQLYTLPNGRVGRWNGLMFRYE